MYCCVLCLEGQAPWQAATGAMAGRLIGQCDDVTDSDEEGALGHVDEVTDSDGGPTGKHNILKHRTIVLRSFTFRFIENMFQIV